MKQEDYEPTMKAMFVMTIILALLIVAMNMCSCVTTKYVPIKEIHTDTIYKARKDSVHLINFLNVIDSVKWRDSIILRTDTSGKIIGKDSWHWRDHFSNKKDNTFYYKSKIDSIRKSKTDSIPVPYPIEKQLNKWQSFKMKFGGYCFAAMCGIILFFCGRFIFKKYIK